MQQRSPPGQSKTSTRKRANPTAQHCSCKRRNTGSGYATSLPCTPTAPYYATNLGGWLLQDGSVCQQKPNNHTHKPSSELPPLLDPSKKLPPTQALSGALGLATASSSQHAAAEHVHHPCSANFNSTQPSRGTAHELQRSDNLKESIPDSCTCTRSNPARSTMGMHSSYSRLSAPSIHLARQHAPFKVRPTEPVGSSGARADVQLRSGCSDTRPYSSHVFRTEQQPLSRQLPALNNPHCQPPTPCQPGDQVPCATPAGVMVAVPRTKTRSRTATQASRREDLPQLVRSRLMDEINDGNVENADISTHHAATARTNHVPRVQRPESPVQDFRAGRRLFDDGYVVGGARAGGGHMHSQGTLHAGECGTSQTQLEGIQEDDEPCSPRPRTFLDGIPHQDHTPPSSPVSPSRHLRAQLTHCPPPAPCRRSKTVARFDKQQFSSTRARVWDDNSSKHTTTSTSDNPSLPTSANSCWEAAPGEKQRLEHVRSPAARRSHPKTAADAADVLCTYGAHLHPRLADAHCVDSILPGSIPPPSSPLVTVPGLDGGHVALGAACDSAWLRYRQPAGSDGTSPLASLSSGGWSGGSQQSGGVRCDDVCEEVSSAEQNARNRLMHARQQRDWDEAQRVWHELEAAQARTDVETVNEMLRCYCSVGGDYVQARQLVEQWQDRHQRVANGTTHLLVKKVGLIQQRHEERKRGCC